jgi:hypothetical protein
MWINLISCAIAGLLFGWEAGKSADIGIIGAVGGLVLGAITGILTNTFLWLLSTFQEIRNYLKEIAERE